MRRKWPILAAAIPLMFGWALIAAYPDDILGERACAVVVPRPGETLNLAEIVEYLRGLGIATFKLPERLELRGELPRNPLGKILKRELREELRRSV